MIFRHSSNESWQWRRRPTAWAVVAFFLVFLALIWGEAFLQTSARLDKEKLRAESATRMAGANVALALGRELDGAVSTVTVLANLRDVSKPQLHRQLLANPFISQILVYGPDDRPLLYGAFGNSPPPARRPEWVGRLLAEGGRLAVHHEAERLSVAKAITGQGSGDPRVVIAVLDLYLVSEQIAANIGDLPNVQIYLFDTIRRDAVSLSPHRNQEGWSAVGRAEALSIMSAAAVDGVGILNGQGTIYSVRQLAGYPLRVAVFFPAEAAANSLMVADDILVPASVLSFVSIVILLLWLRYYSKEIGVGNDLWQLFQAIEQLPSSFIVASLDGNIIYVNPAFSAQTGYSHQEVHGKNPRILQSGLTSPAVYREMWTHLLGGEHWRGHLQNRKKDGTLYWEDTLILPLKSQSGLVSHFVAIKTDITKSKEAQARLEYFESIVSSSRELIALVDAELRYVTTNEMFQKYHAAKDDTFVGHVFGTTADRETFASSHLPSLYSAAAGKYVQFNEWMDFPGMGQRHVSATYSPVREQKGDQWVLTGIAINAIDVTDSKVAETALMKERAASDAKSALLANMSHELRTPLNAVIGYSQAMSLGIKGPLPEQYMEYVGYIEHSGRHLLALVNDILDLSKFESGGMQIVKAPTPLGRVVAHVMAQMDVLAKAKGIDLVDRTHNLPTLMVDELRVEQALLNLVSNAVKFTDRGAVTLENHSDETSFILTVRDTGTGMTPEQILHATEPFYRAADSAYIATRRVEGTGLGLAITKAIMELHGGKVVIQSEVKAGTLAGLQFRLPSPNSVHDV